MNSPRQISSYIIITFLFLFPIFFIPGGVLSLGVAKSTLFVFSSILLVLAFMYEIWRKGELSLPRHLFIWVTVLLPVVYFVSAISSSPSALSLFGYNFEIGTFGYIMFASVMLLVISFVFTETSKFLNAIIVLFVSLSLVAIFSTIKILSGGFPVWGIFFNATDNPIGRWTDLATAFGLLSILAILFVGIIPIKKTLRIISYIIFALATLLFAILNFSTAFIFTLVMAVILFVYFMTIEKKFSPDISVDSTSSSRFVFRPTYLLVILALVSAVFLFNPTISATKGTLGDFVTNAFGVANSEVRPSFSATLSISTATLSKGLLFGSGPNTFSRDWLIHKPVDVNATPFWGAAFPFGIGFIPTQVASTGIVGTIVWLTFLILLIILAIKVLSNLPESRVQRFSLISSLSILLYLWIASFMYAPSTALITLAFIFSGIFVAASREAGIIGSQSIMLSRNMASKTVSLALMIIVGLGSIFLGFIVVEKTIASYYFEKAVTLSNDSTTSLDTLGVTINQAIRFSPTDLYYTSLSRVYFAQAQAISLSTEGDSETNLGIFQDAIKKSIDSARTAVNINPTSYQNWIALGAIYSYLVPKPLEVAGAYENASVAFGEAKSKNPLNPEVPLFVARLELNKGNIEAARSSIRSSIALKEDYADAYLMLAQLEVQEGNISEAINSAEKLALLIPANPAIYFELGLLKYSNKDYSGAENAFSLALLATPDYANAQYYLGLTLTQLGRLEDALKQFEAVSVTNPDSEEVKQIIKELRLGKTSFLEGLTN